METLLKVLLIVISTMCIYCIPASILKAKDNMDVSNAAETLDNVLQDHIVIQNTDNLRPVMKDSPIKPSKDCPFTIDDSDRDDQRLPRIIYKAVCSSKCLSRCVPVIVKQLILLEKRHSKIGTIFNPSFQDVTIGYVDSST
eukprot:gene8234-9115_t